MTTIPRVIPCLLLEGASLVKTVGFSDAGYVGDPVNVISIFNSFEVDEIVLLDIVPKVDGERPDFGLLERMASECFIPLAYGGGIRTVDDARTVLSIGIEKVILNTVAFDRPAVVTEAAALFGSQAVVVSIDARRSPHGGYETFVDGGRRRTGLDVAHHARAAEQAGAGEILVTSIDRDGTMDGFDLELVRRVTGAVRIPVIACGGAGKRAQLAEPVQQAGASAVAAGSLFVFQGRQRSVLVNFPTRAQLAGIFG